MSINWDPSHHTPYDDIPDPDPRADTIEEIFDAGFTESALGVLYILSEKQVDRIRELVGELADDLIRESNRECSACLNRYAEEIARGNEEI